MIPKIPNEFKGELKKNCGYTNTTPRKWTEKEIIWLQDLLKKGYSIKDVAISLGRTETSVSIKVKRINKKENQYNIEHIDEKYQLNKMFLDFIQPKTILDLYCGVNSFYKDYDVLTNDIDKSINADFHDDAFKLLCKLYYENRKFDLIDLDPFGSAYDCFDLAIKMAKKGIVITLGELGHKRWKRLDFVKTHYNIQDFKDFTIENLIQHIQNIGRKNKKILQVWKFKEWKNIGRVYFVIKERKITEQWENKKEQISLF